MVWDKLKEWNGAKRKKKTMITIMKLTGEKSKSESRL